jgi:hypothetical protein
VEIDIPGPIDYLIYGKPCKLMPSDRERADDPATLAAIRAAAQPQPPAGRIEVHPYYLERVDLDALERSHAARQQLQDYLDDAMRAHVLQRLLAYGETLRGLHRDGDL